MAITKPAKIELLNILMGQVIEDSPSEYLPKPSFVSKSSTQYISQFQSEIENTSRENIIKIQTFEDKEIVLMNYYLNGATQNAICIFNQLGPLELVINSHKTGISPEPLPIIYDFKISENGFIFGFSDGIDLQIKDKIHFFIFNDIFPLLQTLSDSELEEEKFFSVIVDVETQIKNEKDGSIIGGNPSFSLIKDAQNKYGFNQDENDEDTYSAAIWNHTSKKINIIRFSTDTINLDPKKVDYAINEEVNLSSGTIGTGSNFSELSTIGILTGDRTQGTDNLVGSIAFSTQENTGQDQLIPITKEVGNENDVYARRFSAYESAYSSTSGTITGGGKITASGGTNAKTTMELQKSFFDDSNVINDIFEQYKRLSETPGNIMDTNSITLTYKDLTNSFVPSPNPSNIRTDKTYQVNISNDIFIKYYNLWNSGNTIDLIFDINFQFNVVNVREDHFSLNINSNIYINSSDGTRNQIDHQSWRIQSLSKNTIASTHAHFWWMSSILVPQLASTPNEADFAVFDWRVSINIALKASIKFSREQKIISTNTSSVIVIKQNSSDYEYNILQSQNNSYGGTKPVFLNALKVYFPLKNRNDSKYYLYEFTSEGGNQDTNKFFNDIGDADYDDTGGDSYNVTLQEPSAINANGVLVEGLPISSSRYSLNTSDGKITILGISKGQRISIEYTSKIGTPKQLFFETTTSGDDIYITSVLDKKELGTISRSIIGAGDNSANLDINLFNQEISGTQDIVSTFNAPDGYFIASASDYGLATKVISQDKKTVTYTGIAPVPILGYVSIIYSDISTNQLFGFNLYKDLSSVDYNLISEQISDIVFKVAHIVGARQNNILFIKAFNQDYTESASWIQIYPDSFKPNTYLPNGDPRRYFALERVSINKDLDRSKTIYDDGFLDVPQSGSTLVATATVKTTDGNNQDNNKHVIYGQTNEPLFEYDRSLIKTSSESITLNFNLETEFKDLLQGNSLQTEATERLLKLFSNPNEQTYAELKLDIVKITFEDGTTKDYPALPHLTLDLDNTLIDFNISLYNNDVGQPGDNPPNKLELINVGGDVVTSIDLTQESCDSGYTNIRFYIVISDDPIPFLRYGENFYGERPWAPLKAERKIK